MRGVRAVVVLLGTGDTGVRDIPRVLRQAGAADHRQGRGRDRPGFGSLSVEVDAPPPHDPAAERFVLCGLLRAFDLVGGEVRRVGLRGDHLYLDLHRRVWGAVAELAHDEQPVTPLTVWRQLAAEWGEWPKVGRLNHAWSCARWLIDLMDDDPTGCWAMGAAVRVRELAERRRRMHELRRQLRELETGAPLELMGA